MDLNEDGYDDVLSGSYSRMEQDMAGLFQVLWGQSDGTFKRAEVLTDPSDEPLIISVENDDFTEKIAAKSEKNIERVWDKGESVIKKPLKRIKDFLKSED